MSKYLTQDGSIDRKRLLEMGLKPSEVMQVFCDQHHVVGESCNKCSHGKNSKAVMK